MTTATARNDNLSAPVSMQEAILRLQAYWSQRGCLLGQPFNTEVGAGTMNPATLLSVLGPETWNVAYVEPSVRPDDSRYGKNPNRLQTHTQFQVILKPEPGNPQELYLGSLAALGIDLDAHDVRFVEDNWAQPAIGAWGLGWEVWLDGMEITQFTYFQQVAGQNLDPIPVEITYGLERILMAIQGVTHFKDIIYAPGVSYGDVFGQSEYEMSRYYLDDADIDTTRGLLAAYSAEADRMITARLPVPAHVHVLKSSHAFNILDSRGAVSTAERAKWFAVMRKQSREIATLWTELREQAGHPRGVQAPPPLATPSIAPATITSDPGSALLFEIGTEELPPHVVTASISSVRATLTELLDSTALPYGEITVQATPRRIAVIVEDIADREPDSVNLRRGPKVAAAYDPDGNPTPALAGFLRSQDVSADDLRHIEVGGAEHVAVENTRVGRSAAVVLTDVLSQLTVSLRADKNMRWSDPELSFSRPIRWLVALLGDKVLPVTAGAVAAGRSTRGHRHCAAPTFDIATAARYRSVLEAEGIVVDQDERRARVVSSATSLAEAENGRIDLEGDADLIDEISNLVESPTGVLGHFDPKYLDLPEQILITAMRKHQRYLPVRSDTGGLLPVFVTMANGDCNPDVVRSGNEKVLRARFEDAAFFWSADLAITPDEFRARLASLMFHDKAGTMADRADRIAAAATRLATRINLSGTDSATLTRAGTLAKFDLATQMVIEMTSLAGTMAREYATKAGEPAPVATALWEMELPRSSGDALPTTTPGALLALADRFDLLVTMLAVGAKLTGSADPYGLRRAATGILAILRNQPELADITIPVGLTTAADQLRGQGVTVDPSVLSTAEELITTRYEQRLRDEAVAPRLIAAVRPSSTAPHRADILIDQISKAATDDRFADLVEGLQRIMRILPHTAPATYNPDRLTGPVERQLLTTTGSVPAADGRPLTEWIRHGHSLIEPLTTFFDDVLVMADDPADRSARLGLLATILAKAPAGIDWREVHQVLQKPEG
ncbi:glycine--tRNA ligase [Nocardia africana]|uniref:Multifunctional fusion protein n=1 Tax=Nocardia africana TaxID=134964 RepID=A0ABW6ND59_9NOCA